VDKLPWIGVSVRRKEDERLLRGAGQFLDDLDEIAALHVAIGRCPYPHARIRGVDARAALEMPGVEAVLLGAQVIARTEPTSLLRSFPGSARTLYFAMAHPVARYEGEAVVAVAAADRYVAEDALDRIEIDYEPLPHVVDAERALAPGAPRLHESVTGNLLVGSISKVGDPAGASGSIASPARPSRGAGCSRGGTTTRARSSCGCRRRRRTWCARSSHSRSAWRNPTSA
jgi:carbon-monoxide dehydrogenase large subunit